MVGAGIFIQETRLLNRCVHDRALLLTINPVSLVVSIVVGIEVRDLLVVSAGDVLNQNLLANCVNECLPGPLLQVAILTLVILHHLIIHLLVHAAVVLLLVQGLVLLVTLLLVGRFK